MYPALMASVNTYSFAMNPMVEGIPANENKNMVIMAAKKGLSCAKPLKSSYVTLTLVCAIICETSPNAPMAVNK